MNLENNRKVHPILWTVYLPLMIFLMNFLFHLWHINQDLPFTYNMDEPHHIHVAAHFSTGDLNPHDFKYPTFWPYMVACILGGLFAVSRFMGLVGGVNDFAIQFFTHPTPFYLTIRCVSAFAISLAPVFLYVSGRRYHSKVFAIAVALFASFSAVITGYGRDATLYGWLFFLVSLLIYFLHQLLYEGDRRSYVLSGIALGLAASTYYLAAPLSLILVGFHFLIPKEKRKLSHLGFAAGAASLCFIIGSPFVLLDYKTFLQTLFSLNHIQTPVAVSFSFFDRARLVGLNIVQFIDRWGIGFGFCLLAFFFQPNIIKKQMMIWTLPLVIFSMYLTRSYYGHLPRYGYCIQFPLFILAAHGFDGIWQKWQLKLVRVVLVLFAFIPSMVWSLSYGKDLNLPDTRTHAKQWIDANISEGRTFLLYAQFHSVPLQMSKSQLAELHAKTKQTGHPRQHYYRFLLDGDQCGGYRIFYLERPAFETQDLPERTEAGFQGLPALDADRLGIKGLMAQGVEFVVVDDYCREWRKNSEWLRALEDKEKPIYEIKPEPGRTKGQLIRIYQLSRSR